MPTPYLPIFELWRGEMVESIHSGAIAIVDSRGKLLASHGDPQAVTYLRSSAKPLQLIPFLEHGGQAAYHLTRREIALLVASHSGTDEQVAVLRGIQEKTGVAEAELLCGVHPLSHKPTVEARRQRGEALTPNRHNCSGKHTAMLSYVRLLGLHNDPAGAGLTYINPAHPIQKNILQTFSEMCDVSSSQVQVGIDGCSAPNFAVPLYNAALGFARLCDPWGLPEKRADVCRTIYAAMTTHPEMVGGPESFDTHLMRATGGRILCKGGAEGYLALGIFPGVLSPASPGVGIVVKIADGDLGAHSRPAGDPGGHARPAVALEILRQLSAISPAELESLAVYGSTFPLRNWRQLLVGEARPCFTVKQKEIKHKGHERLSQR